MLRILILDDDDGMIGMLSRYLAMSGVELTTCVEIEAARALLTCFEFDIVVTDLHVSVLGGLEGMRLIRFVATHFPATTIYVHSAHVDAQVAAQGRAIGATECFRKPEGLSALRERVVTARDALAPDARTRDGAHTHVPALSEYLASDSITAALQPIVRLGGATNGPYAMHAAESLARGPRGHPLANPGLLFAYATAKELLFEVDLCCARAGLAEASAMPAGVTLFLNISPPSLTRPDFLDGLVESTKEHGRACRDIVLEMTEQAGVLNSRAFTRTLAELREIGFRVALDDFGEGNSNLQVLRELRPDYIKLTGLLCNGIVSDPVAQEIVRSQAEMARRLGMRTVIEFVEDEKQAALVAELGVELAQGYLYGRPGPAASLEGSCFVPEAAA